MRIRNPKGKVKSNCSNCNNPIEVDLLGKQRYCRKCRNEYARKNRKRHSQLTEEQRIKANARSYLHVYIRRGKISKEPCFNCGNPISEAHHDDYNKPLDVKWVCKNCRKSI